MRFSDVGRLSHQDCWRDVVDPQKTRDQRSEEHLKKKGKKKKRKGNMKRHLEGSVRFPGSSVWRSVCSSTRAVDICFCSYASHSSPLKIDVVHRTLH